MARKKPRKKRAAGSGQAEPAGEPSGRGWRIAFLVLCTVGVCLSADLLRLHVNVHTDPDYHSYCAMSERVNCDTVAASDYAVFLGLPLALWGLVGYVAMGALTVWGLRRNRFPASWPLGISFWLGLCSSILGIVLLVISHWVIESVCVVCAGTYVVNIGLGLVAFLALRLGGASPWRALGDDLAVIRRHPRPALLFAGALVLVLAICWATVPAYWRIEAATGPGGLRVGVTQKGDPWIGAAEPALEILEYSDYQCPHCQRGHDEMRKLIEANPDTIRLVHRHFPLDHHCNMALSRPFHPQACRYAMLAYCAQQQGAFWEANDFLFAQGRRKQPVTADELAAGIGIDVAAVQSCMTGNDAQLAIQHDLAAGRALQIRGTPTFVVNGVTYPGRVPQDVIDAALSGSARRRRARRR